jgi:formimidoylglutamate deiminase
MANQTLFCKTLLQGDQWQNDVAMEISADGMIQSIEPAKPESADQILHGIVVPGMPNTHSHTFQRLIAGLTGSSGHQTDSFWSWRDAMYRCAGRITPEQFGVTATWVFTQMLKAGFTSCAEFHYLHHQANGKAFENLAEMSERLVFAAAESGIAMTLLPVLYQMAGFNNPQLDPVQRRFVNHTEQYLELLAACQKLTIDQANMELGIAPHSLRAVSVEVIGDVLQTWPGKDCRVHIHISEQPAEVQSCLDYLGARPMTWLMDHFEVNDRWSLIHATHLSDEELQRAAASGAVAGLCPTTEADLGDGIFRTREWLQAGGRFSIGSDSNVRISVTEELRLLEYNERLASGKRNVLGRPNTTCGRFLYQHAAAAGAIACGQPVGSLEPGRRADMVELDGQHLLALGRDVDAALDSWVFAGDESMIKSVWVSGKVLVKDGQHALDESLNMKMTRVISDLNA